MESLKPFLIPIAGLKIGIHPFDFQIDETFFQHFEASPIKQANLLVKVELDKSSDMILAVFSITGTVPATCDRCTSAINLPLEGDYKLILKYDTEEQGDDQADLVYIGREDSFWDVSVYIYEYCCIAFPLIKVYDCEKEEVLPCNEDILKLLNGNNNDPDEEPPTNPIWDALKDLK